MSLGILNVSAIRTNTAGTNASARTDTTSDTTKTDTSTSDSKAVAPASGVLDRDAFLKLLVAQLRYQDPSKPMDASQMISQSAQLTMVDKLESMSSMMEASALTTKLGLAGSVIGKEITFTSDDGTTVKDVVTSVRFADDGTLILHTGDWDVPMDVIQSIGAPTAVPEATAPAATTPAATTPAATTPAATTPAATTPTTEPVATDAPPTTPVST